MTTCERWLWVSPLGPITELTAWVNGFEVSKGIKGRYLPKTVVSRQVIPNRPGQHTLNRRHDYRQFPLPLNAVSSSNTGLQQLLAVLGQNMDPTDGPGILRYVGVDGHISELTAIQTADLDPQAWVGSSSEAGQAMTLMFEADEPYFVQAQQGNYWQGQNPTAWFGLGATGYWVPITLGASAVLGHVTINTGSDAEVWPTWSIVGPGSDPVLTNNTTGKTLALAGVTLAAGEVLVIDTNPGVKTVTGPGGANWFPFASSPQLWSFAKGDNDVTLSMSSSTSSSYIAVNYRPRTFAP